MGNNVHFINCLNCGVLVPQGNSLCPRCCARSPLWETLEPAPRLRLFIGLPLITLLGISFLIVCFIGLQLVLLLTT